MTRLVEHEELKCPKCGGAVRKLLHPILNASNADYECIKCGAKLDIVW